jgi:transcriptional regulator with XRE-family HTH domain
MAGQGRKMAITTALASTLAKRGITQTELAERIGASICSVNNYALGKTTPRADRRLEIANILGVSVEELFGA